MLCIMIEMLQIFTFPLKSLKYDEIYWYLYFYVEDENIIQNVTDFYIFMLENVRFLSKRE